VKTTYNPYTRRFPRGQFIKRILLNQTVHPLYRQAYESDFKCRNPEGYSHDLGAQDVLLDNAGMLFMQQESWWQQYFIYIKILLTRIIHES